MAHTRLSVALIEAPFGPVAWPSIGTSLLKTRLREAGHDARVDYLSIRFAAHVGLDDLSSLNRYQQVCDSFGVHLGDWVFGRAAFPDADWTRLDAAYFRALAEDGQDPGKIADARRWRALAADFLDAEIAATDWGRYDVVGFANSYSQLNASVALAARMRAAHPGVKLIMGGCGCADPMGHGVLAICRALDAVAMGEGDDVIVPLCEGLAAGTVPDLPGVLIRHADGNVYEGPPTQRVQDANSLPVPDFDDYYRDLPQSLSDTLPFYIPIEASRGCWWGAKHHCTFCGLSPTKMPYYRKDAARFLSEVRQQADRHAPRRFMAVDNIMPHEYYAEVCPHMGVASDGAEFFFEVKANLDEPIMNTFADNNISQIQPGIESLSTPVLKLMKKGTTGIANVYTLRLAEERGLRVHWSILFGFEGETPDHYRHQVALSRRIRHLRPPLGLVKCEVERYAPMYRFPERHGLLNLRPAHWYHYCHPVGREILDLIAYRFDADRTPQAQAVQERIVTDTAGPVRDWQEAYADRLHTLTTRAEGGGFHVVRHVNGVRIDYSLSGAAARLLDALRRPAGLRKLGVDRWWRAASPYLDDAMADRMGRLIGSSGYDIRIATEDTTDAFVALLAHGLVVEEDGLALAVPLFPVDARLAETSRVLPVLETRLTSRAAEVAP